MEIYLTLFFSAFGAATIIPLSSEVVFSSFLLLGYNPVTCIIVASLGNCLGVTLNYYLGKFGLYKLLKKIGYDEARHSYLEKKFKKYHNLVYLLSWLPIIGDPITIYAGLTKLNFLKFSAYVYSLRIIRYVVIYYLIMVGS